MYLDDRSFIAEIDHRTQNWHRALPVGHRWVLALGLLCNFAGDFRGLEFVQSVSLEDLADR